jgi:SSS family solute:Na+ symporter
VEHARWGATLAAALKVLPLFLMAIPGALAFALLPPLENSDQVFPALIVNFLPVGLVGLVIAGLIAAIMSTIDSTLNAASTLVMYDFVKAEQRGWAPRRIAMWGRAFTVIFMVVAALWPLVIRDFPGLFNYIQQVFSYAVPPIAAVFLLGMFWKRMTGPAALWTLGFGHTLGAAILAWRLWAQQAGVSDGLPHFTIVAGVTTLLCAAVAVLVSAVTSSAPAEEMLWRRADSRGGGGITDYRWQAVGVVAVVAVIIWAFR